MVVMVSALTSEKDPLVFVRAVSEAARAIPHIEALLVGAGDQRGAVEAALRELKLEGVLHVAGFRSDAEALMAAAHVVVLSSRTEGGLPLALLQAMACGKPVAATAAGGVNELIVPGECGLVVPLGDARRLGEAIAAILTDRQLAERLARGAADRAGHFSIDQTAQRTLALYRRVLAA